MINPRETEWYTTQQNENNPSENPYFHFGSDFSEICSPNVVTGCENYFICPANFLDKEIILYASDEHLYEVHRENFVLNKNTLLDKHDLVSGQVLQRENIKLRAPVEINHLSDFKKNILQRQLRWISIFSQSICQYLKTRQTNQGILFNQNGIQLMFGEAVGHLESAKMLMKHMDSLFIENLSTYQSAVSAELKKTSHLLAKLAGGRAFLSGNIIEMILLFEFFQDIYFVS